MSTAQREAAIASRWRVHLVLFTASVVCLLAAYQNLNFGSSWSATSDWRFWVPMTVFLLVVLTEESIVRYDVKRLPNP